MDHGLERGIRCTTIDLYLYLYLSMEADRSREVPSQPVLIRLIETCTLANGTDLAAVFDRFWLLDLSSVTAQIYSLEAAWFNEISVAPGLRVRNTTPRLLIEAVLVK